MKFSRSSQEHGIPTDGSEQPDISQNELASRMNDSVNLDLTDFDTSGGSLILFSNENILFKCWRSIHPIKNEILKCL